MHDQIYHRGDVLLVDLPFADVARSKARPVLVIQSDIANDVSGNLIVVAISSRAPQRRLPVQYRVSCCSSQAQAAGAQRNPIRDMIP